MRVTPTRGLVQRPNGIGRSQPRGMLGAAKSFHLASRGMPDPTLRFAAGSPKRPNSGVWRLWTHGSDTYLAARIAAHLFKLSMHKSGQWISAFTSQSGVVVDKETGSRRHRTWTRPLEFTPGWVQGPALVIPWVKWRGQFQPIGKPPPPDTLWFPGPARKRKRKLVFNVLFAAATVPADALCWLPSVNRSPRSPPG